VSTTLDPSQGIIQTSKNPELVEAEKDTIYTFAFPSIINGASWRVLIKNIILSTPFSYERRDPKTRHI
jgi:hypothetical protein